MPSPIVLPKGLLRAGDYHWVVNATADDRPLEPSPAKLFDHAGHLVRQWSVLCQGVNGPSYTVQGGDTIPGVGLLPFVIWTRKDEGPEIWLPFGPAFIPLGGIPGYPDPQERFGRAGIGAHAGGSGLGINYPDRLLTPDKWTRCLAPVQPLTYTHGCIRNHTRDIFWLADLVDAARKRGGKVFWSVYQ